MNTLDRYVLRNVGNGTALVLMALVALFSLAEVVQQADDVGEGTYDFVDVLRYVLFTIPARAAVIAPVAGLLGTIFALGTLAGNGELVAMRGLGYSILRISLGVVKAGVVMALLLGVVVEFVAPPLQQQAERERAEALDVEARRRREGKSIWFRDGPNMVRVKGLVGPRSPYDIEIFDIGEDGRRLHSVLRAPRADVTAEGTWILRDGRFQGDPGEGEDAEEFDAIEWDNTVSATELALLLTPPESLAPGDLMRYVQNRRERGQRSALYELILWRKLILPWELIVMMLLGVPFVFGRMRDATLGRRAMVGAMVGVVTYFLDEIAGYLGLILDLNPIGAAVAPTLALLALAASLISDAR